MQQSPASTQESLAESYDSPKQLLYQDHFYSPVDIQSTSTSYDESHQQPEHLNFYESDLHYSQFSTDVTRAYIAPTSQDFSNDWIADSGATEHMTNKLQWFVKYTPLPRNAIWQVETPADHECYVTSTGNIKILAQLPTQIEVHLLQNILYIPDYGSNLFSLTKVARQNKVFTLCKDNSCELIQNNTLIMTGHRI